MHWETSKTLASRSYIGLVLSQFLAAFNDQAIHFVAIFYASEAQHRALLIQNPLSPLFIFDLFLSDFSFRGQWINGGALTARTFLHDLLRVEARLLDQQHEQHEQGPHRANQNGKEREEGDADSLPAELTHAARLRCGVSSTCGLSARPI